MSEKSRVVSVALDDQHRFSKRRVDSIRLIAGMGVEGDSHRGETVQHRSRMVADPDQPNLRQVSLIAEEVLDELIGKGFIIAPADLGENITTRGIDLTALPRGTRLYLGAEAVVEITGLRNPCAQIEEFRPGLLAAIRRVGADGTVANRSGVMGVVETGGVLRPGDPIRVVLPAEPHVALTRV